MLQNNNITMMEMKDKINLIDIKLLEIENKLNEIVERQMINNISERHREEMKEIENFKGQNY
jgi:hypothetical protein